MTLKYSHKLNHCPNMFHDNKSTNITTNKSIVFINCLNTDHREVVQVHSVFLNCHNTDHRKVVLTELPLLSRPGTGK